MHARTPALHSRTAQRGLGNLTHLWVGPEEKKKKRRSSAALDYMIQGMHACMHPSPAIRISDALDT